MKKSKMQGRRPMPKIRNKTVAISAEPKTLTVGDLITAAFDSLGDAGVVVRVLSSNKMADRIGRRFVFV
ncbi:MAG: hypothetical protein QM817_14095 [Archangium sp.]